MNLKVYMMLLIVLATVSVKAQDEPFNPYKSIGKKAKVLTLSNGKYMEFFDTDTIQRIGSILYNTRLKMIVVLLDADSTFEQFSDNSSASRWLSIDPLANTLKNSSYSPYCFVVNNPILLIDPDGRDWFRNDKGRLQYDPNVQSQKDLKDGQTYIGDTYQERNKKGSLLSDYRKDGSIMFSKQKDAYKRMYENSKENNNREEFGVIMKKGVLVLPNYKNDTHTSEIGAYNYKWNKGSLVDPVTGKTEGILATIHTHLSLKGDATPSFQDINNFASNTPYKIFMTMGYDGKVHGAYSYFREGSNTSSYSMIDNYLKPGGLTNSDLIGGYDLINILESITIKK